MNPRAGLAHSRKNHAQRMRCERNNTRRSGNRSQRNIVHRAGSALFEMIIYITITGIVLGLAMRIFPLMLKTQRDALRDSTSIVSLARFEQQLREDMRNSTRWEKGDVHRFTFASEHFAVYRLEAHTVVRELTKGSQLVARENFPLPENTTLRWPDSASAGEELQWFIDRSPDTPQNTDVLTISWHVTGVLGRPFSASLAP